jgi:hypothetical protein
MGPTQVSRWACSPRRIRSVLFLETLLAPKVGIMNQDDVDRTNIQDGGYTAVWKGDEYTISGRGVVIGRLERKGDMWVAIRTAGTLEGAADPVCSGADPKQVLHEFLRREGYLSLE